MKATMKPNQSSNNPINLLLTHTPTMKLNITPTTHQTACHLSIQPSNHQTNHQTNHPTIKPCQPTHTNHQANQPAFVLLILVVDESS
jgi:hypothetical protein